MKYFNKKFKQKELQWRKKNDKIKYYEICRTVYKKIVALSIEATFFSAGDCSDVSDLSFFGPGWSQFSHAQS